MSLKNQVEVKSYVGTRVMWNTGAYPNLKSHVGTIVADSESLTGFSDPMCVVAVDISEVNFPLVLIPGRILMSIKE